MRLRSRLPAVLAPILCAAALALALMDGLGSPSPHRADRAAARPPPKPGGASNAPRHSRTPSNGPGRASPARIAWRHSVAVGEPWAGRLVRGVRLPAARVHYFTWDPIAKRRPDRAWRRWGTDRLLHTVLGVIRAYARAHPGAPRVGVGDLSRPRGGDFGPRFGGIGHVSHQNGLDADVYYPRLDGRERAPHDASQIDRALAQDLVDRFVAAGAVRVFVGPNTGLTGPPNVVQVLANHDNHLHARIAP
jgi:hypothetical protein